MKETCGLALAGAKLKYFHRAVKKSGKMFLYFTPHLFSPSSQTHRSPPSQLKHRPSAFTDFFGTGPNIAPHGAAHGGFWEPVGWLEMKPLLMHSSLCFSAGRRGQLPHWGTGLGYQAAEGSISRSEAGRGFTSMLMPKPMSMVLRDHFSCDKD